MKLSKKLVVTGLLFSSVLGSVNVGSITAMAATAPQAPGVTAPAKPETPANPDLNKTKITFIYKNGNHEIGRTRVNVALGKNGNISADMVPGLDGSEYKVVKDQNFVIKTIDNQKVVEVNVVDNTADLKVNYIVDGKAKADVTEEKFKTTLKVSKDATDVSSEQIKSLINDNYVIDLPTNNNGFAIDKDSKSVTISLRKKVTVNIVFNDELNKKEVATVGLNNKDYQETVKTKEVTAPEGYAFVDDQEVFIKGDKDGKYSASLNVRKLIKTKINFRTPSGKNIVVPVSTPEGKAINVVAPKGYVISDNATKEFIASKTQPSINVLVTPAKPAPTPAKKVTTQINFVEKSTNRSVYSYAVSGANGQEVNVKTPTGFTLVKGSDAKYKLDKSVSAITLYVTENPTIGTTSKISSTVTTKTNASLYDNKGKIVKNRGLGAKSSWFVDQKMVADGVTYYRVATNEWVKASDVEEYATVNATVTTKAGDAKLLYTTEGKAVKNRALSGNSNWFSDRLATINGEKMYRVATNEWVKASDIN